MFVLRSKVSIADESDAWAQYGIWDKSASRRVAWDGGVVPRAWMKAASCAWAAAFLAETKAEEAWTLDEIRAGRPLISAATQDQFVPQMVNFETLGAVNFQKGCYPGQEIVARAVPRRSEAPPETCAITGGHAAQARSGVRRRRGGGQRGGEALAVMPV